MIGSRSLDVSSTTTLRDLQEFSSNQREGLNLRGRKVDGHIQLYAAPSKGGVAGALSKLNPMALHERRLAQKGLGKIFANHERKTGLPVSETLTQHARRPFTSDVTMGILNVTSTIASLQPTHVADTEVVAGETEGPSAETLGIDSPAVKALLEEAGKLIQEESLFSMSDPSQIEAAKLRVSEKLGDVKAKLGDLLFSNFEKSGPSAEQRKDFSTSRGKDAVALLQRQLLPLAFPGKTSIDLRWQASVLTDVALSAFDRAASESSPDRFKSEHEFTLNGVTYKADPEAPPLGKGGFGVVRAFRSDDGHEVAVKIAHPHSDPEMRNSATGLGLQEVVLHRQVEGEGHPNVVSMKGGLRMPNGGFAIVLEIAKYGDLKSVSRDLRLAAQAGFVSPADAVLAQRLATRDMLRGLQQSHANGMMNQDVKDENFLVTADGVVKLGDNGGARKLEGYDHREMGFMTAAYLSPEASKVHESEEVFDKVLGVGMRPKDNDKAIRRNAHDLAIRQLVDRQFPKASDEQKDKLVSDFKASTHQQLMENLPKKRDGFALGVAAQKLLYRHETGPRSGVDSSRAYAKDLARLRSLVQDLSNPLFAARTSPTLALNDEVLILTPDEVDKGRDVIKSVGEWGKAFARNDGSLPQVGLQTNLKVDEVPARR